MDDEEDWNANAGGRPAPRRDDPDPANKFSGSYTGLVPSPLSGTGHYPFILSSPEPASISSCGRFARVEQDVRPEMDDEEDFWRTTHGRLLDEGAVLFWAGFSATVVCTLVFHSHATVVGFFFELAELVVISVALVANEKALDLIAAAEPLAPCGFAIWAMRTAARLLVVALWSSAALAAWVSH